MGFPVLILFALLLVPSGGIIFDKTSAAVLNDDGTPRTCLHEDVGVVSREYRPVAEVEWPFNLQTDESATSAARELLHVETTFKMLRHAALYRHLRNRERCEQCDGGPPMQLMYDPESQHGRDGSGFYWQCPPCGRQTRTSKGIVRLPPPGQVLREQANGVVLNDEGNPLTRIGDPTELGKTVFVEYYFAHDRDGKSIFKYSPDFHLQYAVLECFAELGWIKASEPCDTCHGHPPMHLTHVEQENPTTYNVFFWECPPCDDGVRTRKPVINEEDYRDQKGDVPTSVKIDPRLQL